MTIDELIQIALEHVQASKDDNDLDCSMRYAATAQAAATTAQAMILAQMTTSTGTDGETFRPALRVDTGD